LQVNETEKRTERFQAQQILEKNLKCVDQTMPTIKCNR